ncbi:MAG TPA: fatty acid desaturase, partial [Pirellulales bacterium]
IEGVDPNAVDPNVLGIDNPTGEVEANGPRYTVKSVAWASLIWMVIVHAGVLAAPFYFTWTGLALVFVLHWLTGGIGICLGFHRLLTHGAFQTYKPIRWVIAAIGGMAGEGSALHWVAIHRQHHAHSDQTEDPHSPRHGSLWSHILWIFAGRTNEEIAALHRRWAPDLLKDPAMRVLDYLFLPLHLVAAAALWFAGYALFDAYTGTSWVVYGMFVRLVYVMHSTWFVNSASHMWGYRNYETTDDSRNNWWVAIITYGEGWHNNHHAHPRLAAHGHKWWEIDMTYTTICLMEKCGLAWNVARKKAPRVANASKA